MSHASGTARVGRGCFEDNDDSAVARGVSFDRSGDVLASAWSGGRVKVWDIGADVQIRNMPVRINWGDNPFLAFNSDNSRVIVEDAARENALRALWWRPSDVIREGAGTSPSTSLRQIGVAWEDTTRRRSRRAPGFLYANSPSAALPPRGLRSRSSGD